MDDTARLAAAVRVIEQEGMLLDTHRWDDWLDLYVPDCVFAAPMWRSEEQLNTDPSTELSYIYYESRKGLEDRIARIRSGKSPASTPRPRTAHLYSGIHLTGGTPDTIEARAAWACHILFVRSRLQHTYFGHAEYELVRSGETWRIGRKKTIIFNDDFPTNLDVYCI